MQRLIYISSTRSPLTTVELDAILIASRRNNAAVGVTGLLVAGGRRFLQALEGPEAAVETVFNRIKADPRHHAVVILSRATIDTPTFGQWAMGFNRGGTGGGDAITLPETVATLVEPITDPIVRGYFEGFAQVHAAA